MDERVVKFRVGVMVLSTLIIGGILVVLFGDTGSLAHQSYTIYIHFDDAPGVTEGTPVRKSGILIGRVTSVKFAPEGGVNVAVRVDGDVELYRSEVPQVSGSLLGGDVVIQFIRKPNPISGAPPPTTGGGAKTTQVLTGDNARLVALADDLAQRATPIPAENPDAHITPNERIEGTVAPNAFQVIGNLEGQLNTAVKSLSGAGDEVGKLAANINKMIDQNDQQINRIINKTEETLDVLQRSLTNVDEIIGKPEVRANLERSIKELPELLTDTRGTMNTIKATVESVDRNMRNLEGFTGPLGEKGEDMVNRIDTTVTRLDELLTIMSDFGRKLNSGEGSIGKLMRDPELYQHLNAAARNMECLTRELKPIVADARVFSDKIARHPELLGVRGAIQRTPGTK